jgi:hypothetical protein
VFFEAFGGPGEAVRRNYERFVPIAWEFHEIAAGGSRALPSGRPRPKRGIPASAGPMRR